MIPFIACLKGQLLVYVEQDEAFVPQVHDHGFQSPDHHYTLILCCHSPHEERSSTIQAIKKLAILKLHTAKEKLHS